MDRTGRIRHIVTGLSAATHDKTAIEWSAAFTFFLNNLPNGYYVLGDPAYIGFHNKVLTTYGGNLNQQQQQFNFEATRLRSIVERAIGASQLKWRIQKLKENRFPSKLDIEFPTKCILSAAVLHNRFTNFL